MARPLKQGLDYFPLDVDFFDDDKIKLVEAEFGVKASAIALRLLCKIYKEGGYYYKWGDDECLLFAKNMGDGIVPNFVQEVVKRLVKRSFFDERLLNSFSILTSKGIQARYVSIVKTSKIKREKIAKKYNLLESSEENPKNSEEIEENSEESTQSKVKETKGKKSSKSKSKDLPKITIEEREKLFYGRCAEYVEKYGKVMIRNFYNYWTEKNEGGLKMRFEMERVFELPKRLGTWKRNNKDSTFTKQTSKQSTAVQTAKSIEQEILERHGGQQQATGSF